VVIASGGRERTEMSFLIDGDLPRRNIVLVRVNQVATYGTVNNLLWQVHKEWPIDELRTSTTALKREIARVQ
jgi:hypothetical protein